MDLEGTQSARARLLASGKMLFARHGYEQTSTATIVREAGTSESQLVRYFGGKSGLLTAIFNHAWSAVNEEINRHINQSEHGREAILRILGVLMNAFSRDHDVAFLFLFEGRRVRGNEVALSEGFLQFYELVHRLIARGQTDGSFRSDVGVPIIASALLGCAEGMIRDRIIAERSGRGEMYDDEQIRRTFTALMNGLAGTR